MTHYINGQWLKSDGPSFTSINPATETIIWEGKEADRATVDQAVEAAHDAFNAWRLLAVEERIPYLEAFAKIVTNDLEPFAEIIAKETGKTVWDSRNEVQGMINKVAISIEAYRQRCPTRQQPVPQGQLQTLHRPHGVMGVLGPYNFPGHLPNGHIIPALLAGNTVVFKPSELTPLAGEYAARCWEKAQLPPGVFNLVQGGGATGQLLSGHEAIDGVLFTGSWSTGSKLAMTLAKTPYKILALEMGGNNPLVIGSVHDIETAAYMTIQSSFLSSGQRCTCARRLILIKNPSNDAFIEILAKMTRSLIVGAYNDIPEPFMGPLVNASAAEKILEAQRKLKALGGKEIVPASQLKRGKAFVSPGIIDVTSIAHQPDEEYFGPLLQLICVDTLDDAITEANKTSYGLVAGILSDHKEEFDTFLESIRAGVVNWNTPLTGASSNAPFGGIGRSGNNRPSAFYAADYCAYPVASMTSDHLVLPKLISPGIGRL